MSPVSFSNSSDLLSHTCTSSEAFSRGHIPHGSCQNQNSLQSSLGSTESYASTPDPYTQLHAHSTVPCMEDQASTFGPFSFIPIEPVISLPPQLVECAQAQPDRRIPQQLNSHENASSCSMLQHPDVATHLRELSNCFTPGAVRQQMSQLLDWESQATGSPSQSWDSTTPSCNSTTTHGARCTTQVHHV